MSERTPVEVSACTAAMIAGEGCAASTRSASTGVPHSCSTATTSAPHRAATSHIRCPKRPLTAITTTSPGWTVLTKAASMPAEPVAHSGRVRALAVPHDLAEQVAGLVHDPEELRVEVAEQRLGQRAGRLGVGVGRTGTEEMALADHVLDRNEPGRLTSTAPRVEDPVRVERVLHPPGQRHHVLAELVGQRGLLGAADTVLAGDGAAQRDRDLHDLVERRPSPPFRVRVAGVVDDDRMGVAVAGVGDDRDLHAVPPRDRQRPRRAGRGAAAPARRRPRAAASRAPRWPGTPSGARPRTSPPPRRRRS